MTSRATPESQKGFSGSPPPGFDTPHPDGSWLPSAPLPPPPDPPLQYSIPATANPPESCSPYPELPQPGSDTTRTAPDAGSDRSLPCPVCPMPAPASESSDRQ